MISVLLYLWSIVKRHRWKMLFIVLATIATELVWSTLLPYATKTLIDILSQSGGAPSATTIAHLREAITHVFVLSVSAWGMNRFLQYVITRFQTSAMAELEQQATAYLLGHSLQFFQDTFSGSLVRRVTRSVRAFEDIADVTQQKLLPVIVAFLGIQFVIFQRNATIGIAVCFWVALAFAYNVWYGRYRLHGDVERSELDSKLSGTLADIFSNVQTVKAFAQERSEYTVFSRISESLKVMRQWTWERHDWSVAGQILVMNGMQVGSLFYGSYLWANGAITAGDLLLFYSYFMILNTKMQDVARMIRQYFSAFTDAKELIDVLNEPHAIQDVPHAKKLRVKAGEIVFDRVSFHYGKTALLKEFSLRVHAGERVALVGPSGAGKSTITKLLMRYHDVQRGSISIDGQQIARVTQESLRAQIALVPQEPALFHRSIRDNIRYANKRAEDAEVIRAAKSARCHEFIMRLPDGYDTYVGERGVKLSGGERQRIAIARAILKDAPILVLDEATSSLDSESEHLIQEALHELMKHRTVIVIAHRLSTIMAMDRIVVLQNGRIVDEGTHHELLMKKGLYKQLWDIQAGGFVNPSSATDESDT